MVFIVATSSIVSWHACLQRFDSLLNSNLELLTLSSTILELLQLNALDCSVNEIIYPTAVSLRYGVEPPLIDLPRHWIPWDEDISTGAIYHFYVADSQIFENLTNLAFATGNCLSLVAAGVPLALREESVLIIHTIPLMQLMELAAESANRIRDSYS